jgi:hypothetical protein
MSEHRRRRFECANRLNLKQVCRLPAARDVNRFRMAVSDLDEKILVQQRGESKSKDPVEGAGPPPARMAAHWSPVCAQWQETDGAYCTVEVMGWLQAGQPPEPAGCSV